MDPELIELRPVIKQDMLIHADHLIRAHNKVPNETRELDMPIVITFRYR